MYRTPLPVGGYGQPMALQRRASMSPMGMMSPGGPTSPNLAEKVRQAAIQQRKQYARTPAERLLLKWVICWVLFAAVATTFMLWYLFKLSEKPVVTDSMSRLLSIHDHISTEKYHQRDRIYKAIVNNITAQAIRNQFHNLTSRNAGGLDLLKSVAIHWKDIGMDVVKEPSYRVLTSRANDSSDNKVMLYKDNQLLLTCASRDTAVLAGKTYISPAYMAYSPMGTGMGPPVYVNYGREQDYNYFRDTDLHGKVILVRSGKITGGQKVRNAERVGAAAVVVFPDASDLAPRGDTQPFPDSIWISGSAIQRQSAAYMRGDPLTPGYPAVDTVYRTTVNDAELAQTVAQPISYDDARSILKELDGTACPDSWDPMLGIPCFVNATSALQLQVEVHNCMTQGYIYNVIGIIRGKVEPDRFVMIGSQTHEDTRGSAHPLLSVSEMLVQSQVFGHMHKSHRWTPRRSLMFALFYSEEGSLIGSTEWVEQHMALLQHSAVLYITGGLLSGDKFSPRATPGLSWSLRHVADLVKANDTTTLFGEWTQDKEGAAASMAEALPPMGLSDEAAFTFEAGVPSVFFQFMHRHAADSIYPAQGTASDSFTLVDRLVDPKFRMSRMQAQASALLARLWADRTFLPMDVVELAEWISLRAKDFAKYHRTVIDAHQLRLESVQLAADQFLDAGRVFMNWTQKLRQDHPMYARLYNDIVIRLPKVFITPHGIPTRHISHKNLLYSPEGLPFPGLQDLIRQRPIDGDAFGHMVALITESIIQATEILHFSPIP
ncbi:N-acetylated-alpha-linked acidic dipeptidase 2-like [Dermacentor andersoni]|uniref:N-acetylated-alpha-linked acidic dipeptidase 2-like n=1 Tax=Dermacentor andersoni TaxID=34620 RepID=UPI002415FD98|nr:N-acetylated-alpha-linked acidic dipeptidase 2-like [Dermacentor andersoni]